ncbi:MAG: hypothetical protein LBH71_04115 [Oscillospiraceae bacterium]|nr:hypothetical protein [Oscillospiraceae bacterium]
MDERRRTISSEEQIGEALMRVSNTLEAQRLTKSLDYQEKLRRRTMFRMVVSIIFLATLLLLFIVGTILLFVLWRYMDPILEKVLPFLDTMLGDFGTIWRALVDSSTYLPAFLGQLSRLLEETIILLQGVNGLPLADMLMNLNGILATTNGMLMGLGSMLGNLGSALNPLFAMLNEGLGSIGDLLGGLGGILAPVGTIIGDVTRGIASSLGEMDMGAIGSSIANVVNTLPGLINGGADTLKGLSGLLGRNVEPIGNIVNNLVVATEGLTGLLASIGGIFR